MKGKSIELLAAQNAALREELAALRAKLARPASGQKPRNGTALSVKQRNDLRAATQRIAKAWDGLELPDEAWLAEQLNDLPQELRTLRSDGDWWKLIEQHVARRRAAESVV